MITSSSAGIGRKPRHHLRISAFATSFATGWVAHDLTRGLIDFGGNHGPLPEDRRRHPAPDVVSYPARARKHRNKPYLRARRPDPREIPRADLRCQHLTRPGLDAAPPPAHATELVLIVQDPDVPISKPGPGVDAIVRACLPRQHPRERTSAPQHDRTAEARQGRPWPPRAHGPHRYVFQLFAVDRRLELPQTFTLDQVIEAMSGHVIARARLDGTYRSRRAAPPLPARPPAGAARRAPSRPSGREIQETPARPNWPRRPQARAAQGVRRPAQQPARTVPTVWAPQRPSS